MRHHASRSVSPFGTAPRRSAKQSNRCLPRHSRTGSSSSPTTSRLTAPRRSAGPMRRRTPAFGMSPPDAICRSTTTSGRRSTTRAARTSVGAETTTGSSHSTPNAPSRPSHTTPDVVLCTVVQQYYRDGTAVPLHDPVRALGNVSSAGPGYPGSRAAVPPGTRRARYRSCVLTRSTGRRRSNRASRVDPRRRLRLCVRDCAPGPVRPRSGSSGAPEVRGSLS